MSTQITNTQRAFLELVADAKTRICEVTLNELRANPDGREPVLVDVREESEWNAGHVKGAIHLSRGIIEQKIGEVVPDPQTPLVCYCGGGNRSALAVDSLRRLGYTNAASLIGGFRAWEEAGLPVSTDHTK